MSLLQLIIIDNLIRVHTGFTVWGGGGGTQTSGVYVMGVHKQAPSRGAWGHASPRIFLQNRCSQIDSDTVASCHRIYIIIIRKDKHRIIAHGQNILLRLNCDTIF